MPNYQDITTCLSFDKWYRILLCGSYLRRLHTYGLQAYGEEAMKLYNEVYKCIMCGRPPREPKRSVVVEETIDG